MSSSYYGTKVPVPGRVWPMARDQQERGGRCASTYLSPSWYLLRGRHFPSVWNFFIYPLLRFFQCHKKRRIRKSSMRIGSNVVCEMHFTYSSSKSILMMQMLRISLRARENWQWFYYWMMMAVYSVYTFLLSPLTHCHTLPSTHPSSPNVFKCLTLCPNFLLYHCQPHCL